MWIECQRINTPHSFITVLLISYKLPVNAQLLATRSIPDYSLIAPWSAEAVILNFFLASEATNVNTNSNIAFPDHVLFSVNEPSH